MKLVYIDTETTGTDTKHCAITQLAGTILADGKSEDFNFFMKPFESALITDEALIVQKKTKEEIMSYPSDKKVFVDFTALLGKYVDRYEKSDKFFFIGYNSRFDSDMIRNWFERNGDKYYGSWFWMPDIDVMALAARALMNVRSTLPNFRLETVAKYLFPNDLEIKNPEFHDARYDILMTRKIMQIVGVGIIKKDEV
jgi:DNA polymerase III subunit epsilon